MAQGLMSGMFLWDHVDQKSKLFDKDNNEVFFKFKCVLKWAVHELFDQILLQEKCNKRTNLRLHSISSSSNNKETTSFGFNVSGLKLPPLITILWICKCYLIIKAMKQEAKKTCGSREKEWHLGTSDFSRARCKIRSSIVPLHMSL